MSQIINVDDLSSYMNKTLIPGQAQPVVDALNAWVQTFTKRCWGETKQVAQRYGYKRTLWLRHPDIISVDLVTLGFPGQTQTTLPSQSYFVNEFGRITFISSLIAPHLGSFDPSSALLNDYMSVTYTYGVVVVPDDLKLAALGVAAGFYNWAANGNKDIVAASVGSYHLEYAGKVRGTNGAPDPASHTDDANWAVIRSYRVRRI